jgi:Na+-driven multidrug efflux pump
LDAPQGDFEFSIIFAGILCVVMTALCFIFTDKIIGMVLTQESVFNYGVQFARILQLLAFLFGVFYCLTNALQAMGAAISLR